MGKAVTKDNSMNLPKKERRTIKPSIFIKAKKEEFIFCSIVSAFINLVFISNLTKSSYGVGILSIPAAIVLGAISVSLDVSKCLHAIQINTLAEIKRKLRKFGWESGRIKFAYTKWFVSYLLYVLLSIATSVALSSMSIGAGITRNSNLIKQIDEYIVVGETYSNVDSTAMNITMNNLIGKASDTSEKDATEFMDLQVREVWPKIQEWQDEYTDFKNAGLDPDDKSEIEYNGSIIVPYDYWTEKDRALNNVLSSSKYSSARVSEYALSRITLASFETAVRENFLKARQTANNDAAVSKLSELTDTTMNEAYEWIQMLNSVGLENPKNGEIIVFDTDPEKSTKVLVASALMKLKSLKVDVENDSGDVGSSSKIFLQIGGAFTKANKQTDLQEAINVTTSSSLGPTEIMIMSTLLFLTLLVELAINQFSSKQMITREMVDQYLKFLPEDFDINKFMLAIYSEQRDFEKITEEEYQNKRQEIINKMLAAALDKYCAGNITKEEFEKQKAEILEKMTLDVSQIISEYKKKNTPQRKKVIVSIPKVLTVKNVPEEVAPEAAQTVEEPKVEETVKPVEEPKVEPQPEKPKSSGSKLKIKSAEREIKEMLNEMD